MSRGSREQGSTPAPLHPRTSAPPLIIRASEIGEYTYCARAWWLGRVQGVERADDAPLIAGTGRHRRHGRAVAVAVWAWRIGLGLLAMIVVLGIVLLLR